MSRRLDLFIYTPGGSGNYRSDWTCYVQGVLPSAAKSIIAALERQGEIVGAFTHSKAIGHLLYRTAAKVKP